MLRRILLSFALLLAAPLVYAALLGQVQGIVHDPTHRPIAGAKIVLRAVHSDLFFTADSNSDGAFSIQAVPPGVYNITVSSNGFATLEQTLTVTSNGSELLHFPLEVASVRQTAEVRAVPQTVNPDSVTPETMISRADIEETPGADRTNSLAMITDYTPGAYMTHDMLHMRGGHELNWMIDGVAIPSTNIGSNIGPQIDPRDIDTLEVDRGSYGADLGDRTYGMFDVIPRTGFETSRQGEFVTTLGSYDQTDSQLSLGNHTERFAWFAAVNGNRSSYGLMPPIEKPVHDAENGYGGFTSLIFNRDPHDQLRFIGQLRTDYYQIPYDPNPTDWENQLYDSSGLRDGQHETDGLATFSWIHTLSAKSLSKSRPSTTTTTPTTSPTPTTNPQQRRRSRPASTRGHKRTSPPRLRAIPSRPACTATASTRVTSSA